MTKRRLQKPPTRAARRELEQGLLLLDRFTSSDLDAWKARSEDLDELYQTLYFGLEPERIKRRQEFLDALQSSPGDSLSFSDWTRIVDWQWTNNPLSAIGSLKGHGGRFNIGSDVDECGNSLPFPALYLGGSPETAYREYYQCDVSDAEKFGLTREDLALQKSTTTVQLKGYVERVFDATDRSKLERFASVLKKFKTPPGLIPLARRLKLGPANNLLIRTAAQLQRNLQDANWRRWPSQFGLPSPNQKFGDWVRAAGYEAIKYESAKNPGTSCLAIFPDSIVSRNTFVEILGSPPSSVSHTRLDLETAESLSGWNEIDVITRRRAGRR